MLDVIRVLHVYRTYFPDPQGGTQEAIRQIALATREYNIESTIFTLSPQPFPKCLVRPEGTVIRSRSWLTPASCDLGGLDAVRMFRQAIDKAHVVIYHFPWPYGDLLHVVSGNNRPSMVVYHSDIIRQRFLGAFYRPLMWRTLHSMSAIIATSPTYVQTSPILSHPLLQHKVHVIPLGINERSYSQNGDTTILQRLGVEYGEIYFLFIGVLRYYKGLESLVKASSEVNARVIIAGKGPEEHRLHTLAAKHKVNNLLFAGQISDEEKICLLQNCQAVVLPSHLRSEAFGVVLVEGAMFGKPLISCEIGTGTSFVNINGETGLLVPPDNVPALTLAMNTLLDEQLAKQFGKGARARYDRLFAGPILGENYAKIFRELAGC